MKKSVIALGCLCILGIGAFAVVSSKRSHLHDRACISNLIHMDQATCSWALENKAQPDASLSKAELFGTNAYIKSERRCPKGGLYTLGSTVEPPICSIAGHQIRINPNILKAQARYLDQ